MAERFSILQQLNKRKAAGAPNPFFQAKLFVNAPNDAYVQEADTVADRVMGMTDNDTVQAKFFKPVIQKKCAHCEEEKERRMQRKEISAEPITASGSLESYVGSLDNTGQSLSGMRHSPAQIQRQHNDSEEKPLESDDALLACLVMTPFPLNSFCFSQDGSDKTDDNHKSFGGAGASGTWSPAPAPPVNPPVPKAPPIPTTETFFHGSTWRIAQTIPGNVKPIGGGDFGKGFYTHHDADKKVAEDRARWEGCRLCQKMSLKERYAGVIRFDVPDTEYKSLFSSRKTFDLTSTTQKDYAAKQKKWLDFVSGRNRGREPDPTFDAAHMSWRHQRVDPPPGQDYFLIEGPMYKGVEGLPGSNVPPRSAFDPYAEGTALPQQVVWNYQRAMDVLSAAPTTLKQYDAQNNCAPVDPPVPVKPLTVSIAEEAKALEEAQIELTGH